MGKVSVERQLLVDCLKYDFNFRVDNPTLVEMGLESLVYQAELEGQPVFIRINREKGVYPVEAEVYKQYAVKGIPVPRVLAFSEKPPLIGYPIMVITKATGKPLGSINSSEEEKAKLYFKAGEIMRRMHELKVLGFGWITIEDGRLKGKSPNIKEFWESQALKYYRFSYIKDKGLVVDTEYQAVVNSWEKILSTPLSEATILHQDFHGEHIFTDGKEITGIIDLGDVMAGDPRYDIAMSFVFQKPYQREAFKKGYGELANDPLILDYMLFIAAFKLAYRHQKGMIEGANYAQSVLRETSQQLK